MLYHVIHVWNVLRKLLESSVEWMDTNYILLTHGIRNKNERRWWKLCFQIWWWCSVRVLWSSYFENVFRFQPKRSGWADKDGTTEAINSPTVRKRKFTSKKYVGKWIYDLIASMYFFWIQKPKRKKGSRIWQLTTTMYHINTQQFECAPLRSNKENGLRTQKFEIIQF